ncbi:TPA: restriction endonuclease subunit S [Enterococcus faecium]|uniref:restriction endonuclease subunit S n=1 Tax=Enterococcus lactis TaxID=357441 RepID=UPI002412E001|nr:restriction endonuclease subunit S [Enterococcus lactis]HAQ4731352.1 restriction endonuclease subunit S [Enterococcus faecium]
MSNDTQPEIRFPGFTDDWEQRKLGDSIKVMDGDRGSNYPHESDFIENGDTLFLDTGNVTKTGFKFDSVKYITKEKDEQLRAGKLEKNDLVLTSRGTLGNIGFYDELIYKLHPKVRINSAMLILRNTDEQLSYSYLHTLLKGRLISDFMRKNQVGSAQPHITKSEFLKLNLNVPYDIEEQKKIGTFFKQLDDTIALHQRKLDLLKETKKGFLQKMFPKNGAKVPEIRFPGFTEAWEQRKLGQVANYRRGSFPQPYGNKEWYDGENSMPFVQVVDVGDNLRLVEDTKQKISELAQPKSVFVEEGKVVVTLQGSIGRVAITQYPAYVDRTLLIFESYKAEMDEYYFAYVIQQLFEYEKTRAPGGTIKTITKEALSNFTISFPSIAEQKKLGKFFEQLDDTIALQQRKLDLLKETKKGFLQKMFV